MTFYRTVVLHIPPTPLGLLPERWAVEHWCTACRRQVTTDQLILHARGHYSTSADTFATGPSHRRRARAQ